MAYCTVCGKWAGVGFTKHGDCAKKLADGEVSESIQPDAVGHSSSGAKTLSFGHIVWGVFLGMWLFSISASLLYGFFQLLRN